MKCVGANSLRYPWLFHFRRCNTIFLIFLVCSRPIPVCLLDILLGAIFFRLFFIVLFFVLLSFDIFLVILENDGLLLSLMTSPSLMTLQSLMTAVTNDFAITDDFAIIDDFAITDDVAISDG